MTEQRVELRRTYRFEAAHSLPRVPPEHKCARLHGHSYRVEVVVAGPVHPRMGWLLDFAAIDEAVQPVIRALDHQHLNEMPELENPTSENLAIHIWTQVERSLFGLAAITVCENEHSACTYRGAS